MTQKFAATAAKPRLEVCSQIYQEALCHRAQQFYTLQDTVAHNLSNSNTEPLPLGDLFQENPDYLQRFLSLKLDYGNPQGNVDLTRAISQQLYQGIEPEEILLESGSEEGLLILLQCLLSPQDHLIIQFPCYPPVLEMSVDRLENQISLWSAKPESGWEWDLADLKTLLRENTKAIFLCNPHNPTGSILRREQLDCLIDFARKHQLLLICDEVYRFLEYEPTLRLPPVCELYEWGLSLGSLSKSFGLPGLRTGWVVCRNPEIRERLITYKSRTTLCNSVATQYLSELALARQKEIRAKTLSRVQRNFEALKAWVNRQSAVLDWIQPQAGTVAFLQFRSGFNAERFCREMAAEAGVLCLPGSFFSFNDSYFRIGFGKARFGEALQAMDAYFSGHFG